MLNTQAQIDSFNYSAVKGNLYIREAEPGSITNLNGLRSLQKMIVTRVTGMGFIEGGNLYIDSNAALVSLEGLENLQAVPGNLTSAITYR